MAGSRDPIPMPVVLLVRLWQSQPRGCPGAGRACLSLKELPASPGARQPEFQGVRSQGTVRRWVGAGAKWSPPAPQWGGGRTGEAFPSPLTIYLAPR